MVWAGMGSWAHPVDPDAPPQDGADVLDAAARQVTFPFLPASDTTKARQVCKQRLLPCDTFSNNNRHMLTLQHGLNSTPQSLAVGWPALPCRLPLLRCRQSDDQLPLGSHLFSRSSSRFDRTVAESPWRNSRRPASTALPSSKPPMSWRALKQVGQSMRTDSAVSHPSTQSALFIRQPWFSQTVSPMIWKVE